MSKAIFGIAAVVVIAIVIAFSFTSESPQQASEQINITPEPSTSVPTTQAPEPVPTTQTQQTSCDSSYPDVCIPPYPPDLDCGEIQYANFKALPLDPHGFDGDNDGIGCESGSTQPSVPIQPTQTQQTSCDSSYPDVCIPSSPPDLDCGEIQYANFKVLPLDPHGFDGDNDGIGCESGSPSPTSLDCSGTARCISGVVTQVIDGDTIKVDDQSIRFALTSAPELNEIGGLDAKNFVEILCPVGSEVVVDEDDGQTEGSYDRMIGVIYCNGINLSEAVIESGYASLFGEFCSTSEFSSTSWAQKYGCTPSTTQQVTPSQQNNCDPSYPDFCIPSSPPDLDCKDIPAKRFTVLPPDPHRFDGDKDGIGCES